MFNYFRYLPLSEEDERWGLSVLSVGCTSIKPRQHYPYKEHPSHHNFSWANGRILSEFQLVYITGGEGVFESTAMGEQKVKEGTVILLFPGEWHRYKPCKETGWDEYWIGFTGTAADNIFKQQFFTPNQALLSVGFKEDIIALLTEVLIQTKKEKTGYQPLISGMVMHILGRIYAICKQNRIQHEDHVQVTINKAMVMLRDRIQEHVTMESIAAELMVSYAWFRKTFKLYTGMAPQQYCMQLKIERAKMLLNDLDKPVKEIAYELSFGHPLNFSKLFKEKVGLSPEQYRSKYIRVNE